jgi:hypothetical protein
MAENIRTGKEITFVCKSMQNSFVSFIFLDEFVSTNDVCIERVK